MQQLNLNTLSYFQGEKELGWPSMYVARPTGSSGNKDKPVQM